MRTHYFSPQFDPIEKSVDAERSNNLTLMKQIGNGGSSAKQAKRELDVVKVYKAAVRFWGSGSNCTRTQLGFRWQARPSKAEGKASFYDMCMNVYALANDFDVFVKAKLRDALL